MGQKNKSCFTRCMEATENGRVYICEEIHKSGKKKEYTAYVTDFSSEEKENIISETYKKRTS